MSELQYGMRYTGDLFKDWWAKLFVGIFLIGFGFLAFAWPAMVLLTAIVLIGGLCLMSGIVFIIYALSGQVADRYKWMSIAEGVLLVLFALLAFFLPDVTAITLLYILGLFALIVGLFRLADFLMMPNELRPMYGKTARSMILIGAIFSVLIGLIILLWPWPSMLAILWLAGAYGIVFGTIMIASGIASIKQ
ncbi:MAG: hypothetical protein A4E32_01294 [Methanomassiliicoccales archaeon PtaU1.Bin124]|nr:MAG: hypothetical protein A4E32_01294 [Methanomassiliicoccales archaeon PtaU1.Bin124]